MGRRSPRGVAPSRAKSIFFAAIVTAIYLVLAEVVARVVFAALAGSGLPLIYGLDREIRYMEEGRLRDPVFYRDCYGCGDGAPGKVEAAVGKGPPPPARRLVYAFGGSTTRGRNCAPEASSWPEELAALRPDLEVVNFGRNGTNSDYAFGALEAALAQRIPDLVLWANWVNELDIVFTGPERNRERLARRFGALLGAREEAFASNRARQFLARLDRTLFEVSAFYLFVSEAIRLSGLGAPARDAKGRFIDDAEIEMAVANSLFNLEDAARAARRHGFRLIVLRLPMDWGRFERTYAAEAVASLRRWDEMLRAAVEAAARRDGIAFLDLHRRFARQQVSAAIYCDPVHMWRPGHRLTAQAIDGMLRQAGPGAVPN